MADDTRTSSYIGTGAASSYWKMNSEKPKSNQQKKELKFEIWWHMLQSLTQPGNLFHSVPPLGIEPVLTSRLSGQRADVKPASAALF